VNFDGRIFALRVPKKKWKILENVVLKSVNSRKICKILGKIAKVL
jgi:hypothetical protein